MEGVVLSDRCDTPNARAREKMVDAMFKSLGVVSTACEMAGISRQTHYRWLEEFPEYRIAIQDAKESMLDFMESKLHELANGVIVSDPMFGKNAMICMQDENGVWQPVDERVCKVYKRPPCVKAITTALKCIGKERGWTERNEITGKGGESLVQVSQLSPEAAAVISNDLEDSY